MQGINTTPYTMDAIFTAHTGAERMDKQGYIAENTSDGVFGVAFRVTAPGGWKYKVYPFGLTVVDPPYCNCEQYKAVSYCKHIVWCANIANDEAQYLELRREEEARWQEIEEREFADFNYETGFGS